MTTGRRTYREAVLNEIPAMMPALISRPRFEPRGDRDSTFGAPPVRRTVAHAGVDRDDRPVGLPGYLGYVLVQAPARAQFACPSCGDRPPRTGKRASIAARNFLRRRPTDSKSSPDPRLRSPVLDPRFGLALNCANAGHQHDVFVNGEPKEIAPGTTVAAAPGGLRLQPRHVAVERNRDLVPRSQHAACVLETGDRLEIVTLVGGG